MSPARMILAAILLTPTSAVEAQDLNETRAINALRDGARAQERQARSMERQESLLREQALREDRDRRNAARDARSSRRFDQR